MQVTTNSLDKLLVKGSVKTLNNIVYLTIISIKLGFLCDFEILKLKTCLITHLPRS